MNTVHLILPELFLPRELATDLLADVSLPILQKMLARSTVQNIGASSVELALCKAFGLTVQQDVPVAALGAIFDGLGTGYWLRADPVHLLLQRDQMRLSVAHIPLDEAQQVCAGLNDYFAGQGLQFFAPDARRWYLRLEAFPDVQTVPLSEVIGSNVRGALLSGQDAPRWHRLFNEIQMYLHAHPVNEAREARGELTCNSLWLWGGGAFDGAVSRNYDKVGTDEDLAELFAAAAKIPFDQMDGQWHPEAGRQLLFYGKLRRAVQSGNLGEWRNALQAFDRDVAQPIWQALQQGKLSYLKLEVIAAERSSVFELRRSDILRFWRRAKSLPAYSLV